MTDRRYSTSAWQRLRKAVLARDGYVCQIRGARCTHVATTCDHIQPVSERPDLFWEPANLRAACRRCNFGGGTAAANANARRKVDQLEALVANQQQLIGQLLEKVASYENQAVKPRRIPAIH